MVVAVSLDRCSLLGPTVETYHPIPTHIMSTSSPAARSQRSLHRVQKHCAKLYVRSEVR